MRRNLFISALVVSLLMSASPSYAENKLAQEKRHPRAHGQRGPTKDAVLLFRKSVSLRKITRVLISSRAKLVSLQHADPIGGFLAHPEARTQESLRLYAERYRRIYNKQPRIAAIRLDRLPTKLMRPLKRYKASVQTLPEAAAMIIDTTAERTTVRFSQASVESDSVALGDEWVPDNGQVFGQTDAVGDQVIVNSFQWNAQADLSSFGGDVYEHDLKLKRNDCQEDDFWADRNGVSWGTTAPPETAPYFDVNWLDQCIDEDFTIGYFHPQEFTSGTTYESTVVANPAGAERSRFELIAYRLSNNCPPAIHDPGCVGSVGDADFEKLLHSSSVCHLPGSYPWEKGQLNACYAYRDQVRSANPIAHWPLDEKTGTTISDVSGNHLDGVASGAVRLDQPPAITDRYTDGSIDPRAMSFGIQNGIGSVTAPANVLFESERLTAETWIRTTRKDTDHRAIVARSGAFYLALYDGKAKGVMSVMNGSNTTTVVVVGSTDLYDGAWHHVGLTYNGTTARLFVDGTEDAASVDVNGRLPVAAGNRVTIGNRTGLLPFVGDVDEVAVYDHALTPAQFQNRYTHKWSPTPVCNGSTDYTTTVCTNRPMGYWRLGEPSGNVATDYTSLQNGSYQSGVILDRQGAVVEATGGLPMIGNSAIGTSGNSLSYVSVPYEPYGTYASRQLTAEAWVRTSTRDTTQRAIISGSGFYLSVYDGKVTAVVKVTTNSGTSDHVLRGATDIYEGAWHHIAVTYDGSLLRLYVDGVEDAPAKSVTGFRKQTPGVPITIGNGSTTSPFMGDIDEVAIYDHALPTSALHKRFSQRWTPSATCEPTASYTTTICTDKPIGYWRLGEQSGPTATDHASLQHGTYQPGVILGRPGALGEANSAIGMVGASNSYVNVPYEPYGTYATRQLTAETWVRTSSKDTNHRAIVARSGAFYMALYDGKAKAVMTGMNGTGSSTLVLPGLIDIHDGAWHHVAFTYDGTNARLYVDGHEDATPVAYTGRIAGAFGNSVTIGYKTNLEPFVGDIDEVALYDHALTAQRITAHLSSR